MIVCVQSRRRFIFCEGIKSIAVTQVQAHIPIAMVERDRWLNLCIDVNSFVRDCFTRTNSNGSAYGTP